MKNSQKLYQAIKLASVAHKGQSRKGKVEVPYICHPVFVGMELLMLGYDEDTVVAGILHDLLEDTPVDREIIKSQFGKKVLGLIEAVTELKDPDMSKEEKRKTWRARKEAKLEKLKASPPEARAIAAIDLWANILELRETIKEEGSEASKYFNVDLSKKLEHLQKELDFFAQDNNAPYSRLIQEMKSILEELVELWGAKNEPKC